MSDIVFDGMVFDRLREIGDQSDRIAALESEIARLRLTGVEREAVEWAAIVLAADKTYSSALRGLARRLGGER